jgi:hypothetical protein
MGTRLTAVATGAATAEAAKKATRLLENFMVLEEER